MLFLNQPDRFVPFGNDGNAVDFIQGLCHDSAQV